MALGRFPNVYANLETTTAMLWQAPGRFEAALALLMQWGGPERILWGTGCTVVHPQHLITLFWNFAFGADTQARHGIPPIDEAVKRMILGRNYLRMLGRDEDAVRASQRNDAFDGIEMRAPWTVWTHA